ncbi:MAG: hypothetical protein WC283_00445 [Candidatus Paceibacterota bacterium]|jgi:hypothetical protein
MKKNIYFYTNLLAWALVFFLAGNYVFGWTTPSQNPPAGNITPSFSQWTTSGSNIYYNTGNVGIGTTSPGAKLEVAGNIKITGGSPGSGKVLTSDASGLASWSAPSSNTPPGGIIMYSGAWNFDATGLGTGSLAGWALCNGNNGTPNLSDKFVMGTINSSSLNTTGGTNSYSLAINQLPSHTHSFSTDSAGSHCHTISIASGGSHTHTYERIENYAGNVTGSGGPYYGWKARYVRDTSSSGSHTHTASCTSSGAHTHSGTTNSTGSGSAIDNRPSFIQLAFIMKL